MHVYNSPCIFPGLKLRVLWFIFRLPPPCKKRKKKPSNRVMVLRIHGTIPREGDMIGIGFLIIPRPPSVPPLLPQDTCSHDTFWPRRLFIGQPRSSRMFLGLRLLSAQFSNENSILLAVAGHSNPSNSDRVILRSRWPQLYSATGIHCSRAETKDCV